MSHHHPNRDRYRPVRHGLRAAILAFLISQIAQARLGLFAHDGAIILCLLGLLEAAIGLAARAVQAVTDYIRDLSGDRP